MLPVGQALGPAALVSGALAGLYGAEVEKGCELLCA